MTLDLGLAGKRIVIAGAGGGGIGTTICRLLAQAGASVAGVDISKEALALAERASIEAGGTFLPLIADTTSEEGADEVVRQAVGEFGSIDGLVNVVGIFARKNFEPALDTELDRFDAAIRGNLTCAWLMARAVASQLAAQGTGGSLVLISSLAGVQSMPFGVAYSAAKGGVDAMTRTLASEWGPLGIRVNSVAPGTIRTPTSFANEEDLPPSVAAAIPLGHRGKPEDIAGGVIFMLSDLAAYVTGQTLVVDGGVTIRPGYLDNENLPGWAQTRPPSMS